MKLAKPPISYNELVKRLNKKMEVIFKVLELKDSIVKVEDIWMGNFEKLLKGIKELRKSIHITRQIENNSEIREEIRIAIERRQINFQSNTKRMIDSILKRKRDRVVFDNIVKKKK